MKIALALTAAVALAATGFVAVPAAAAPEQPRNKKSFSLTGEFTGRQIKPSGNAKGIGDFTVTTGKVSGTEGNGTLTTVIRVVAPGKKSDAELRDTQSQVQLKGGQIFAQAVNEDPKGKPPETLHIMPIVGGTGSYAGARGTLNLIPQGKSGKYLMMYDVFVDKNLRKSTFTFPAPVTERVGTGVGSVILKRAAQDDVSYISVATGLGSAKGSGSRQSIDLQIFDATGASLAQHELGGRPVRLLYAPRGEVLAAALSADASIALVERGVVRRVVVGGVPDGLAFSSDGRWLYVSDVARGAVSVVDVQRSRVVQRFTPAQTAGALLVLPRA